MRVMILIMLLMPVIASANFTSAHIIAKSIRPDCLDYCIIGVCFWLRCDLLGCRTETTLRISHNNPDLVATVYEHPGQNPWIDTKPFSLAAASALQATLGSVTGTLVGGGRSTTKHANPGDPDSTRFKEVGVFGSPMAANQSLLGNQVIPFMCPTEAKPLFPYMLSESDFLTWRYGLPELIYPASWTPGLKEVGSWFKTWGSVYPRQGFLVSQEEPKAAAVFAQRAADVVTRFAQPHVYVPVSLGGAGLPRHVNTPGPVTVSNAEWQMIYPGISSCGPFGRNPLYAEGKLDPKGQYAFQLWRPYSCCTPNPGAQYLFSVAISSRLCPNWFRGSNENTD